MPELPEVEFVRRQLEPVLRGARIERVQLRRRNLRRPFPRGFAARLEGRRVRAVDRRGKYLIVSLDSADVLLMHLGMSGSFRVDRGASADRETAGETRPADRHDHVVFELSTGAVVTFNDPRRFGVMDLAPADRVADHRALKGMGVEPLAAGFDAAVLARACAGRRVALKTLLLDQRLVAGLGNIYASEALHVARLSPRRAAATLAAGGGTPNARAARLAAAIKSVLRDAIARKEQPYRAGRFRVYDRAGEPCPRRGCGGTVRRIVQGGRSTFYCPTCQR